MSFNKKIKNKIKKHALEDFPNECCGLIIGTEEGEDTYKCNNQAKDKKNFFRIGVEDYLSASTEGDNPSWSSRSKTKLSIEFLIQFGLLVFGKVGSSGGINAQ